MNMRVGKVTGKVYFVPKGTEVVALNLVEGIGGATPMKTRMDCVFKVEDMLVPVGEGRECDSDLAALAKAGMMVFQRGVYGMVVANRNVRFLVCE